MLGTFSPNCPVLDAPATAFVRHSALYCVKLVTGPFLSPQLPVTPLSAFEVDFPSPKTNPSRPEGQFGSPFSVELLCIWMLVHNLNRTSQPPILRLNPDDAWAHI